MGQGWKVGQVHLAPDLKSSPVRDCLRAGPAMPVQAGKTEDIEKYSKRTVRLQPSCQLCVMGVWPHPVVPPCGCGGCLPPVQPVWKAGTSLPLL